MNQELEMPAAAPSVKSADRCLDLLELLARFPDGLTLTEVCDETGWPKSSALGLLRTLHARDYITATANGLHYWLGPRVASLGSAYLDRVNLGEEGYGIVRMVSRAIDETVHLAVLRGTDVLYIAKEEGGGQMRMVSAVGRMIPAHGTGVGKMLLASLSRGELDMLYPAGKPLHQLTAATVTDRDEFLARLDQIREQDYATDDGESTVGLKCIAAPVRNTRGTVVAAMSVSVPEPRFTADRVPRLHQVLVDGARQLSLRLGCPPSMLKSTSADHDSDGGDFRHE